MLVLLIHGAYTSPWHWHRLVPHLEEAGCTVVVPELPCDDPEAGIERYVETVEAELAGNEDAPVVVGSSFGAVTACVFASRHPVRALVTVCGMVPQAGRPISEELADITQPAFAGAIDANSDGSTTFRPQAACELVFTTASLSSRVRRRRGCVAKLGCLSLSRVRSTRYLTSRGPASCRERIGFCAPNGSIA